jgi:phage gpG-like protein
MKNSLAAINGKKITVGIHADVGGDILRYAAIHEFGGTITAKNVKNLAIPLTKEAKQKSPRDIEGLFFIKSKKGKALLVRDKRLHTKKGARRKNAGKIIGPPQESELEPLYVLKHSVTIPERSYIRASFDNGRGTLDAIVGQSVDALLFGGVAPSTTLERIGVSASQMTRQYINDGKIKPPTGELARSLKTQETTLFDQGRLVGSIAHKVE